MNFPKLPSAIMPTIPPLSPEILLPLIDIVVKVGDKLFDKIFNKDKIKEQPAYNPEKSDAVEVMEINSALMDYRSEVKQATAELEDEIKKTCENVFTEVINTLEFANEEFEFYRVSRMKRKLDAFLQDIDGIFSNYTAKRISLDDTDLIAVLKMRPGELKGQRLRELKERVLVESVEEVNRRLNCFVREFFEDMEFSVDHRMAEIEQRLDEKMTAFKAAELSDNKHTNRLEEIILRAEYIRSVFAVSKGIPS